MRRRDLLWSVPVTLASSLLGRLLRAQDTGPAVDKHAPIARRALGRTGEQVSMIGIGGFHIGAAKTEQEGIRIVRNALDAGVNFLDNCWDYNGGDSEVRMGKALRDGYRAKAFLMTKIDGRDAGSAARQIDESLRRLQTDHLDLLQIHEVIHDNDPERVFAAGGAMTAVIAAQKAGKTRYIGFTGHKSPAIHRHMLDTAAKHEFRFDTVQMPLNVMDAHDAGFEQLVLPLLLEQQIGVLGMKPLGSGVILKSGKVSAVECLNYALSLPTSVVITGCDSLTVLQQALRVARGFTPLTAAARSALLAKTAGAARDRSFELYKISERFDGTTQHPEWLG